jgi:hypothetical protein
MKFNVKINTFQAESNLCQFGCIFFPIYTSGKAAQAGGGIDLAGYTE